MSRASSRSGSVAYWLGIAVTLSVGVLGFFLLSMLRQKPAQQQPSQLAPLVETVTVTTADEGFSLQVDGEVIPYRKVTLSAEVAGRVQIKHADCWPGNYLEQGTLLYKIDPRDYELEIRRLQQLAIQADVALNEMDVEDQNNADLLALAEQDLKLQEKDFRRIESLIERQLASASEYDIARTAVIKSRNALQTLENLRRLLGSRRNRLQSETERIAIELEKARLELARTEIYVPFDGIVRSVDAEVDTYVERGAPLAHLEDTSKVEVRFHVRLENLRWLWRLAGDEEVKEPQVQGGNYQLPALAVDVALDIGGAEYVWSGRLDRYDGQGIQPATRTVPCVVVVDDPHQCRHVATASGAGSLPSPPALLRGMFVTLRVQVPAHLQLLRMPVAALRPGNRVWVWRGGRLQIVPIAVAHATDEEVLIQADESSLTAGDVVIVSPLPTAVDGMQVRRSDEAQLSTLPTATGSAS